MQGCWLNLSTVLAFLGYMVDVFELIGFMYASVA